ncbi:MAG: SpoIIE family protein phosphatase [Acidobacteriota bacterium]|nr:SpoIIE family protein phosphatase [Acidobacteriota bacterium]
MTAVKGHFRRHIKALGRRSRRAGGWLTPALTVRGLEALALALLLLFTLTGARGVRLDHLGARADAALILAAAALLIALEFSVNRRFVHALGRRFAGHTYDERRLLFDLGRAARAATNINQLYELVVKELAGALGTSHVSIFVSDERTGDFIRRVCSTEHAQKRGTRAEGGGMAEQARGAVLTKDSLVVRRLRNLSAPLGITQRDLDTWLRSLASCDRAARERRELECATLLDIRARLLVGVTMHGRLVGILSVGPPDGSRQFSADDKRMLMSIANQLAFIIVNAKLAERMVAEEGLRRELALAREVQQRLLPAQPPPVNGMSLSGFCQPASAIGGDYYDFLRLGENQVGFAVGDVAGKGIGAALLMSNVQASWRSQILAQGAGAGVRGALAELVQTMNRLIFHSTGAASYVTFFCATLDTRSRALSYVNAGHNPPLLVRKKGRNVASPGAEQRPDRRRAATEGIFGGAGDSVSEKFRVEELPTGGPVLGVFEEWRYEQDSVLLESGDLLIAYTDGLTEALNAAGEEFGVGRLSEALAACAGGSADEVREHVVERVRGWCAGAPQHDDLTFVVLTVN